MAKPQRAGFDAWLALHEHVLGGDQTARERVAVLLLDRVRGILRHERPLVDAQVINDAVEDAIVHYIQSPWRYDPSLARLDTFIVADARHRLRHALRADARRRLRDDRAARRDEPTRLAPDVYADMPEDMLARLIEQAATGRERAFLQAKARGERSTTVLAQILGLSGLSPVDRQRAVKRTADRLLARMKRLARSGKP